MISQEAKRFKPISNDQDTLNPNPSASYNKCRLKVLKAGAQPNSQGGSNNVTLPQIHPAAAAKRDRDGQADKPRTFRGPLSPSEALKRRKMKLKSVK